MKQYHDLLRQVIAEGQREPNRTGIDTLTISGAMLKFDLRDGFPAVTTKKLAFNQVKGELIGFLNGVDNAAEFRSLGCNVWDQNANENKDWLANENRKGQDDLGRVYGVQWRDWRYPLRTMGYVEGESSIDQIVNALSDIRFNPQSRRIIVNAWNPAELDQMALPPCHIMFQLLPRSDGTLHMNMYQRSCDMFLGVPFNIASYALLLELFAAWSGRKAATLTMFMADVHIYVNHIHQVNAQLTREEYPLPKLWIRHPNNVQYMPLSDILAELSPADIHLSDYQHHEAIKAPMAV